MTSLKKYCKWNYMGREKLKVKEEWGNSKERGGERDRFSLHVQEKSTNKWIIKTEMGVACSVEKTAG